MAEVSAKTWFITGASSGFGLALTQIALEGGIKSRLPPESLETLEPLQEKYPDR